jgi:hypothetical protein
VLQAAEFSLEAVKEHYGRCYFWEFGRRQEWRQIEKYMVFGLWCLEAQKQTANKLIGLEAGPKALKPLEVESIIFLSDSNKPQGLWEKWRRGWRKLMSRVLSVFWSEKSLLGESAKQFKASFPSQTILLERGYKIWLDWALKYVRTGLDQLSEDYKRQYAALTKRDQEQLREQFISKREFFYEGCLKKGLSILSGDKQEDYRKRVSHWYEEVDQKGLEYLNILPASKVEEPTEQQSLVVRAGDDLVRASSREGVVLTFSREEQQLLGCQQIEEILFFENKAGDLEQMLENISRYGKLQIRQAEEKLRQVNESRPAYLLEGSRSYKDFCSRVDKVRGELLKKVRPLLHPDGIARLDIEES